MQNDFEHIQIQFAHKAKHIFFEALDEFQMATKSVDRSLEEYKFNQLKEQHVHSLKQRLTLTAREYIEQHQHHNQGRELDQMMQKEIKSYLHQFVVKIRSI